MTEMIKNWLTQLYETEIKEVKGTISNNKYLIYSAKDEREEYMYAQNEMELREYLEVLEELKKKVEEKQYEKKNYSM